MQSYSSWFKNTQRGFTLVEVVISLALIVGVFVVFQAAATTIHVNRRVQHEELALRIASSEMEYIRSLTYATVPTSTSFAHALLTELPSGQGTLSVSDYNADTKQVVVTVSWRELERPTPRTVSLTTLITDGGL